MFSKDQERKANKCKVIEVGEGNKSKHFKVIFTDSKGDHEHQVSFDKKTKEMSCDCSWCSYYGLQKKNSGKQCYNCLAIMKKLKMVD
ncbi:MAG: hypothetical protein KJ906_03325 [Nanoarchaeota archaeon]|nr:hypothetical protein [Nanoarchaeota archaeon]